MKDGPFSNEKSIAARKFSEPHLGIDIRDIIYPKTSQLEERESRATEST